MTTKITYQTRRRLIGLIFLGLAVRAIMPAGYMPAPIGEGGPFVPCPAGLLGANLFQAIDQTAHHQHGHDTDHGRNASASEFCPFGAAFGSVAPATEVAAAELFIEHVLSPRVFSATFQSLTIYIRRARGPPITKPLHL